MRERDIKYDGYICFYDTEYPNHYTIAPGALKLPDNKQVPIVYNSDSSSDSSLPHILGFARLESDSCGITAHCQFLDNYDDLVDLLKSGEYDLGFTAFDVKYTTDDKGVKHYTQGVIRKVGILPYPYNLKANPK